MDPNQVLKDMEDIIEGRWLCLCPGPLKLLTEKSEALKEWIDRGGFAPNWAKYPMATRWFRGQGLGDHTR